MYDSEPQSVFVVLYICNDEPHFSILQLEPPKQINNTSVVAVAPQYTNVDGLTLRFIERMDLPSVQWSVSPPTTSTGDLYLLPSWSAVKPLCGYRFNFRTASFQNINEGRIESIVNLRGRIYRMELHYGRRYSVFDCYDPDTYSWKALKPLTYVGFDSRVSATAVWGDTILYNVGCWGIWAYDVDGNEWYHVDTEDSRCRSIVGEAVVLQDTIYALTAMKDDVVLALSIKKEISGGDLVFKCCVRSEILMPFRSGDGNEPISDETPQTRSTHLVHLGNADFCLVEGCDPLFYEGPKPIHVTYMRLVAGEGSMAVLSDHWFETWDHDHDLFRVLLSFSLPKCKTTALEQGKHLVFKMNPFVAVRHSIYVRHLRANVTVSQLEKGLKVFGSIKRGGIQVKRNKKGKSFAFVDFESFFSKQCAIEASTVSIGGCSAKISENQDMNQPRL